MMSLYKYVAPETIHFKPSKRTILSKYVLLYLKKNLLTQTPRSTEVFAMKQESF
jgi:hypothetical protein